MGRTALFALLVGAAATALAAPVPKETDAVRLARIYGKPGELTERDHYALDGEKLRLFVNVRAPGVPPAPERRGVVPGARVVADGPCVWRDVKGDFTLTAKVSLSPDAAQAPDPRVAGLLAWAGPKSCLTVVRHGTDNVVALYTYRNGAGTDRKVLQAAAQDLFLRIRRDGATLTAAYSTDGKNWNDFFPCKTEWDDTIKVGVCGENGPGAVYEVVFDEYKLTAPKN